MAVSFSRPDPSSPASVADAGFSTSRRGFDQQEVREFLRMVAAELGRLRERERFLERELRTAQTNPDLSAARLDDQELTRLLGEETARVLATARESAGEIRRKAEEAAAQLLNEAADEAARLREEAEVEASRRRADAGADAEAELAMAKQQGREMVNEARAYRERVLSELARRRELAREQIEQLLHGRDRLMQSFERARLVAVDVVAELQPLGEPDEYVNLTPTTGPVPVMVPNSRPDEVSTSHDRSARPPAPHDVAAEPEDAPSPTDRTAAVPTHEVSDAETDRVADEPADDDIGERGGEIPTDLDGAESDALESDGVDSEGVASEGAELDVAGSDATPSDAAEVDTAASPTDDVVVDLFARLRADAADADDSPDETTPDALADDAVDGDDAATDDAADVEAAEEPPPTPFEERDAELIPLIVASARKLKRVLADEQNDVLESLRRREPVTRLDDLLPAADEHRRRFDDAIADELTAAAAAGARAAGRSTALRKADATSAVRAGGDVLSEWVVEPLRERLERCVDEGDGSNTDITKRVRAVYREWKTQHIDEQLDDVVRAAHGRGAFAAIDPDTAVEWVADPGHATCADCDDNTLAGVIAAGHEFPTGHTHPPAHIGCRCLLRIADR
jgi:DivIVA domain-containing protein